MSKTLENRPKILKEVAKAEYPLIEKIIIKFTETIASKDRTKLKAISQEAFPYEKKYIPELPDNKSISQKLSCETLIMTVGFQKEPIILSILCLKPKIVILLPTEETRKIAQEVEQDSDVESLNLKIYIIEITESDATENYRIIKEKAFSKAEGITVADPTGGRKIMVASLALAAFYFRLPMVYLHSIEKQGIASPFSETLELIQNPFEFFGDKELEIVEYQFNSHFYKAAIITCNTILTIIRDPGVAKKVEMLKSLIEIYRDWDAFEHSAVPQKRPTLSERLEAVRNEFFQFQFESMLPENIDNNISFLKEIDNRWKNKLNIIDEYRIVDIYANALRRGSEKQAKYDDAVARLYRVIEMCSSLKLINRGIKDVSKPDYDNLCHTLGKPKNWLSEEFERIKKRYLPAENLALDDQMTILSFINDMISKKYIEMRNKKEDSRSLMDKRNRSILAHGTDPLTEEDWEPCRKKTKSIIDFTIGKEKFSEILNLALHGKINLRLTNLGKK